MLSTRDFSTTLLQTSGDVPTPRRAHGNALIGTTLLIYGGSNTNSSDQNALSSDSLCFPNLDTSDFLMTSPTPADDSFVLQNRENRPALWSIVLGPILVCIIPLVSSSLSSVVRSAGIFQ